MPKVIKAAKENVNQAKKRVLMLCPKGTLDSGGVISNFELIKYLIANDIEVSVLTSWKGKYNEILTAHGIRNKSADYNWWAPRDDPKDMASRSLIAVEKIAAEIREFRADVVITNTSHIPWGGFAASMCNTPHIWTVREFPINNFSYIEDRVDFIGQYSNKIMANSRQLSQYYNLKYEYDVGSFMSYVDIDSIKLADASLIPILVSPNYISETKNQVDLIRAASILRQRRPDLKFKVVLMGDKDTAYWPKFKKMIRQYKSEGWLEIYDRVDDPWSTVSKNDILVQTSVSESIGRTTTEAMKLGVPVIASDIPGHREAFDLGGGVLYKLGDPDDLSHKIEYSLDHRDERIKKADKVKRRVTKTMSRDACSQTMLDAINQVYQKNNPMRVNRILWPYLRQFILDRESINEIVRQKNNDTDMLHAELENIRNSKAYRLGRKQVMIINKVLSIIRGDR